MMKLTKKQVINTLSLPLILPSPPPDVLAVDRGLRIILSTNKWGLAKLFDRELLPFLFKYDRF